MFVGSTPLTRQQNQAPSFVLFLVSRELSLELLSSSLLPSPGSSSPELASSHPLPAFSC